ncbi:MAG: preprotein translocase subunit SecG [Pseudomonadota bacterium]|jgi:preprotein translocase subunit SecG|nr:preprotein translocase subunit SecG [Pseudomonadota bacterium]|tara:strand:- start:51 stop:401 length:351 start_codon:yes stop_codon:yes gene_type:complete
MIYTILMVSAVVLSILIIFFILMQKGKGDASGMFGGGSSGAVFGASGAGSFITKLTTFLVFLFFLNCLALAYIAKSNVSEESIIVTDDVGIEEQNSDELQDQSEENNSLDEINIPD